MRNNSTSRATKSPGLWYANAMEQLVEVVQQLSLARKLETIMDIVRKAARELTEADGAIFVLRDGDRCFYAEKDAIAPLSKGQRFPMSACICSWAMLNGKSAVIEDIYADPRIPADAYRPTFVKSLAMVPIRTVQPVGAIGIYWTKQHRPCPEQVKIIQALADTTAVAMENVNVYSELEIRVNQRTFELQAILDNVQAGIIFSVNEKIVRTNPKSAEIFHLDEKAMIGMRTEKLFRSKAFHNAVTQLSEGKVFDTETMIILQDGTESWVRMIAKSLDSAPGSEIWVINDIGEAKAREKVLDELRIEAEAAARFKSRFLATMSHEIRTPLTGMLGMLELLSMTHLDNEQRSTMNAAWNSGRGLLSIVNDILDWSKIEERKLALSPRSTSIPQLLHESVNTYSRIAIAKGLLLKEKSDPQLSAAYFVDPLRLSQIINNFVSNAIKFTDHGNVELRAELVNHLECGDRIRISVRDTGIGISKDVQKRLFQRYSQESADTARVYGGTGLGLSICRRLADLMDGKIDLESEPGQGSTFSIMLVLPISAAQGEAPAIPHLEIEQKFIEPLLESEDDVPVVLAVDDHPINRELLCRQIRLLGLRADSAENGIAALDMWRNGRYALVITDCHMPEMDGYSDIVDAESAESAMKLFESNAFDLVITDVNMPGMNGLQFIQMIRSGKTRAKPGMRIMVLSLFSQTEILGAALALDVNGFLVKPVIPSVAEEKLDRAITEQYKPRSPIAYEAVKTDSKTLEKMSPKNLTGAAVALGERGEQGGHGKGRFIALHRLRPGMILAEGVYLKDGTLILSAGHALAEISINRLNDLEDLLPAKRIAIQNQSI